MNYRDYKAIMEDEQLVESQAVRNYLERAIYWNSSIKSVTEHYPEDVAIRLKKRFEEEKIKFIFLALDIARFEKDVGVKIFEEGELFIEKVAQDRVNDLKGGHS